MPRINDTVQIAFHMRGDLRPFWQIHATVSSVTSDGVVLDGFDRQVAAALSELKPAGPGRWILMWEIRTRP